MPYFPPASSGSGAPTTAKYIVQQADATLSAEQALESLATGVVKNTTTTGVLSIAANTDLPAMTATVGGAVPTPPNNTTTFLRGDGTFAAPVASVADPNPQSYTPGSFTLATGKYVIMANELALTTTQQVVLQGTSRLTMVN